MARAVGDEGVRVSICAMGVVITPNVTTMYYNDALQQEYPEGTAGNMTFSYKWALLPPLRADGRCSKCKEQVNTPGVIDAKRQPGTSCKCKPLAKGAVFPLDSEKGKP